MSTEDRGKTIWEMLMARLHGQSANGTGLGFYNPLGFNVGSAVSIPYANGAELAEYNFSVSDIREYTRTIGTQPFAFTDYALRGVHSKTPGADAEINIRLRTLPNPVGGNMTLLLRLDDEFEFAEDFLGVVNDDTGIFEVTDDATGAKEKFERINNLRASYHAAVLIVKETTPEGKAVQKSARPIKIEYWDYWRDIAVGDKTAKEWLFVEMDCDTGWFQIWRGREFFD